VDPGVCGGTQSGRPNPARFQGLFRVRQSSSAFFAPAEPKTQWITQIEPHTIRPGPTRVIRTTDMQSIYTVFAMPVASVRLKRAVQLGLEPSDSIRGAHSSSYATNFRERIQGQHAREREQFGYPGPAPTRSTDALAGNQSRSATCR